jgi:hypothetical protein
MLADTRYRGEFRLSFDDRRHPVKEVPAGKRHGSNSHPVVVV